MRKLIYLLAFLVALSAATYAQAPTCRVLKTFYLPGTTQPDRDATVTVHRVMLQNYAYSRVAQIFRTDTSGVLLGADGQPGMQLPCGAAVYVFSEADVALPGLADNPGLGTQYIVRNTTPQQLEELIYARTLLNVKGGLAVGGATTPGQLTPGADGTFLRADSTQPLGLRYDALTFNLLPTLTASRALESNVSGVITPSAITSTELATLGGISSNIQAQLNLKAPLASPALTGVPTAPTAADGTATTQLATTAFAANANNLTSGIVALALISNLTDAQIAAGAAVAQSKVANLVSDLALKAPLASPALTGVPTVPTAAPGTSTTQAASTAFVGVALGSYQPLASPLSQISALSPSNDDVLQRKAGVWTNRTVAQLKTDLGLATIATSGSASDLGAGIVPNGRLTGAYTGVTGLGTLTTDLNSTAKIAFAHSGSATFIELAPNGGDVRSGKILFTHGTHANTAGAAPNEVSRWAYNANQQGTVLAGETGLGFTIEGHFEPSPGEQYTEAHLQYWTKAGVEKRPLSFTINKNTDVADVYFSTDTFRTQASDLSRIYTTLNAGVFTTYPYASNRGFRITDDGGTTQIQGVGGGTSNLQFSGWNPIIFPSLVLYSNAIAALANVQPGTSGAYDLGTIGSEWRSFYANTSFLIGTTATTAINANYDGKLGFGTTTGAMSGTNVIALRNGTAPSASIANTALLYAQGGELLTQDASGNVLTLSNPPAWGVITGTLSNQTDLNTALGLKAALASPTFTGTPAAPTAAPGTNTTQLATTAFVSTGLGSYLPLAGGTLTGNLTITDKKIFFDSFNPADDNFIKIQTPHSATLPNYGDFNFHVSDNDNGNGTTNYVAIFGWNVNSGGGLEKAGAPAVHFAMESSYLSADGNRWVEIHMPQITDLNGVARRLQSYTVQGAGNLLTAPVVHDLRATTFGFTNSQDGSNMFAISPTVTSLYSDTRLAYTKQYQLLQNNGTARALASMNVSNQILLGDTNNTMLVNSPTVYNSPVTFDLTQVTGRLWIGSVPNDTFLFNLKNTGASTLMRLENADNNSNTSEIRFTKSRGGSPASAGDVIGNLNFSTLSEFQSVGNSSTITGGYRLQDFVWKSYNVAEVYAERMRLTAEGALGLGTSAPDKRLEINSTTGATLRHTYNDTNGSAVNFVDESVSSSGDFTIAPSGGDVNITGALAVSGAINVASCTGCGGISINSTNGVLPYRSNSTTLADSPISRIDASTVQVLAINGGSAANDDLTLQGTSNATRTTSYVNLQPNGGNVGIGTATPAYPLDVNGIVSAGVTSGYARLGATATNVPVLNLRGYFPNNNGGGAINFINDNVSATPLLTLGSGAYPVAVWNTSGVIKAYIDTTGAVYAEGAVTIGAGAAITKVLTGTGSLDFAQASANACETLTLTVTGAADGDVIELGIPHALANHNTTATFAKWRSASNTVSVRRCVISADGSDPAAATLRATVIQH